jgi:IclR family acetate operon transcriptional repressor
MSCWSSIGIAWSPNHFVRIVNVSDTTSAERVLAILEMFERERRALSLKELSEYCRIPPSTCHSLVQTLLKHSYLYNTGRRKDLYPTRKLYDIGVVVVANDLILQRLEPAMRALREATRETIILGKRHKDNILYLEVLEGPQTVRYSAKVGELKPLHSTCIGKTILSGLPPEEVRRWLADHPPEKVTENTITSYARLMDDLREGKKRGYFTTRGENVPDVSAVAFSLNINDESFGLAVAGPSHRIDARFDEIIRNLRETQKSLLDQGIARSQA